MIALNDVVFVKLDARGATSAGGIHIPELAQRMSEFATVVAVGPGKRMPNGERLPTGMKPGDRVVLDYIKKHREETILPDGTEVLVFRAHEICAVMEG